MDSSLTLGERTNTILKHIAEAHGEPVFYYRLGEEAKKIGDIISLPVSATPREGYILPEFEALKKNQEVQETFADAFIRVHNLPTTYKPRIKKYMQLAAEAAEEVAAYLGKEEKVEIPLEDLESLEKFNKFLDTIMKEEFYTRPVERRPEHQQSALKPREVARKQTAEPKELISQTSKLPKVQGSGASHGILESIPQATKLEVLSLVKALKLVDSPEARDKAVEDLRRKLREMTDRELRGNALLRACVYALTAELIALGKEDRLEKLLTGL
jgi:hypothetical protein